MNKLNILLVGEESAGINTLKLVLAHGHHLCAVMTSSEAEKNCGGRLYDAARRLGCTVLDPLLVREREFASKLREQNVDILLNVHALHIIDGAVIAAPRIGSFNLHPGPLPRYAGLNAVSWAIYRGETQHGVTLHKMTPDIDAGPIVYQTICSVENTDNALSLSAKCARDGIHLIEKLLLCASIDPDGIPLRAQDPREREYFDRRVPNGGVIDWNAPARNVYNFIRAADYSPFPSPWGRLRARLNDQIVSVLRAELTGMPSRVAPGTVSSCKGGVALVACDDEWVWIYLDHASNPDSI
jgi:methionyl-tRNA formyltransferase